MSFSGVYFLVDWIERQYWCFSPLISVCCIDKRMHFFCKRKVALPLIKYVCLFTQLYLSFFKRPTKKDEVE